jgi:hypothetical protein
MSDLRSRAADLLAALRVYPKDGLLVLDAMEALDAAIHATDVPSEEDIVDAPDDVTWRDLPATSWATDVPSAADQSDPIETFSHPFVGPVVIDGHLLIHTSDCEWPRSDYPVDDLRRRDALANTLHDIGGEFCRPFTELHPIAMHRSQAAAILAHPAMVATLRATDVPSEADTVTYVKAATEEQPSANWRATDVPSWREASRRLHASGDDEPYATDVPSERELDHIAWAQHVRAEHEATHGEAEQCGAECIRLGLADFDGPTCPYCGADGYDNVTFLSGDPINAPRCRDCWGNVSTDAIDALGKQARAAERARILEAVAEMLGRV